RPMKQCLGDPEPLSHPTGIAADPAVGHACQPGPVEHGPDLLAQVRAREPAEAADEVEQLAAAHPAVETRILVEISQAPAQRRPVETDRDARDGRFTGSCPCEPGEDPDRRRLAGAVRTEETEDRPRRDVE